MKKAWLCIYILFFLLSCYPKKVYDVSMDSYVTIEKIPVRLTDFQDITFALLVEGGVGIDAFKRRKPFETFIAYYDLKNSIGSKSDATKSITLKTVPKYVAIGKKYDNLTLILTNATYNEKGALIVGSLQRIITIKDGIQIVDDGAKSAILRPVSLKIKEGYGENNL